MADEEKKSGGILSRIGQTRIIAGLIVLAVVGGVFTSMMLRTGGPQKALLYSGLELSEASEIAGRLDQANIKYEMRGDGSSIFVARDAVMDARLMLSAEGLPSRGSIGYEIFDKQDALGATTFIQNVNRLRALEGEIAKTINTIENVKSTRVHLVLPERRLFEKDEKQPTASIVIDMVGRTLDGGQIRAIRNLVASAVPGLEPDQVTILDKNGRLLAAAASEKNGMIGGLSPDERRAMIEEELRQKVLAQLEPIVGSGLARVQISADVDFNRVTKSSELYDPDGRVVRSTETVEETDTQTIRGRQEAVTVNQNLPNNNQPDADGPQENSQKSRLQETVNYEISKTLQTEVIEGGTIKRLSIAVAVDHLAQPGAPNENGEPGPVNYQPRTEAQMAQLAALVRSAVGYNAARGDAMEVVNIRFASQSLELGSVADQSFLGMTKNDIMRGVELIALLIGGLALIFFVLRPLVSGLLSPPGDDKSNDGNMLTNDPRALLENASYGEVRTSANELEKTIDVANVTGQVKASSMKKIADLIESHPDESVSILRTWLNESDQGLA